MTSKLAELPLPHSLLEALPTASQLRAGKMGRDIREGVQRSEQAPEDTPRPRGCGGWPLGQGHGSFQGAEGKTMRKELAD